MIRHATNVCFGPAATLIPRLSSLAVASNAAGSKRRRHHVGGIPE